MSHKRNHPRFPIDKYRLVNKESVPSKDNEIRVKAQGRHFYYAAYAGKLLFDGTAQILVLGTGKAIPKIIQVVEYLRKRVKGLHVVYSVQSTEFEDEYEPTEEGLDNVTVKRLVATLQATVSLKDEGLKDQVGYMAPLDESELLNEEQFKKDVEEHQQRKDDDEKNGGQVDRRQRDNRLQQRGQPRKPQVPRDQTQGGYGKRFDRGEQRPKHHQPRNYRYGRGGGGNRGPRNNRGRGGYRDNRDGSNTRRD